MFEFLYDQNFLNALAVMIGPLAFFAAPTEQIENLLLSDDGVSGALSGGVSEFVHREADRANPG